MSFDEAVFSVLFENIEDHRKLQACLRGVVDCVQRWGNAGQLPIPAQPQENAEGQKTPSNTGGLQCPFLLVERFADNGAHSHWSLVNRETGEEEWTQQAGA